MPRRKKMLVADLLCGAGGSSTGAERALVDLGLIMDLVCLNHWPTAIETHTLNHPKARHYCQDIATVRPHICVPEGYLDLLMASPTCTHHSVARGGKPTSDQQRSDPWHIVAWFTELRVKRAIIENVPEFVSWGPVDSRTRRPIKSRKGEYFRAWCDAISALGGKFEYRILNAADYGDATTRRRFFMNIRFDGKPIRWPTPTHAPRREGVLPLGLKTWCAAREIIDWNIRGRSIFNRKKPLSPKTLARIWAGAVKFGWPEPFLVILRNHMAAQSVDAPLPTIAAGGTHIGLAQPVIVSAAHGVGAGERDPHRRRVRSTDDPLGTIHAGGGNFALAEPMILSQQASGVARSADDPLPTITTGGAGTVQRPGCARHALVEPFMLSRQGGGAPRSIDEPTPTQVAKHSHALIAPYYGSGSGETCRSVEQPLPTVTTKERFGMVVPVTHSNGHNAARPDSEPLPTITTAKGGEFGLVMPVTHHDASDRVRSPEDPLPTITSANRGELAFVAAAFGERAGQAPRVHDLADPVPTICATGRVNLVEGVEGYDILFRMLEPRELAAAMGFSDEDRAYEFVGTKTEQVRQIGNAVPVNTMKALVAATMADAAGR